jgi:ADP-heptose:LPS heptosyltransferase
MIEENSSRSLIEATPHPRLAAGRVTLVYTMYHHLGDFVVMGGLLRKFDLLGVEFESLVAHRHSPHVCHFDGETAGRFVDVGSPAGLVRLRRMLRERRRAGRLVVGVPMAPGSLQAFAFFWMLKKLGAVDYIVDFNLINADILTPPRRRYIFDRHLAQAAEIFKRPEWLDDESMPLAMACPPILPRGPVPQIGFFPWSGRSGLPEFRWPEARWADLANRILSASDATLVLLGKDERFVPFEQAVRAQLPPEMQARFIARPAASVPALVDDLCGVAGLVTLNTSALHLAHALKLPAVALCGSTADFWLPEAAHIRIVRDSTGVLPASDRRVHDPLQPSLQHIPVDDVARACREHFALRGAAATP